MHLSLCSKRTLYLWKIYITHEAIFVIDINIHTGIFRMLLCQEFSMHFPDRVRAGKIESLRF